MIRKSYNSKIQNNTILDEIMNAKEQYVSYSSVAKWFRKINKLTSSSLERFKAKLSKVIISS